MALSETRKRGNAETRKGCAAVLAALAALLLAALAPVRGDEIEEMRATQEAFHRVVAALTPSLVRIETVGGSQPVDPLVTDDEETKESPQQKRLQNPFRDTAGAEFTLADGPTTGIVWSPDGYIITSSFNFVREPMLISVTLPDGRRMAADLVARDQVHKIALLKVDAAGLRVPAWSPAEEVRVGQWALALGLGFGGAEPSVTAGIISAVNRMRGTAVQTDAKLSPANYGGPLCDLAGRIVGLCTPMAQRPGELAGVEMYDSGVGFAIPRTKLEAIVARLMKGESAYRGWLGVSVDNRVHDAVVISNVAGPSPMRAAGVRANDRILEINGVKMKHFGSMLRELYMIPAGGTVRLKIGRYLDPDMVDGQPGPQPEMQEFEVAVALARNTDLGPLPEEEEPFDPSNPFPLPPPPP